MRRHGLRKHYMKLPLRRKIILIVSVAAALMCISLLYDALHPFREPPAWLMLICVGLISVEIVMLHWTL